MDIIRRWRTEKALREWKERFRVLALQTSDGLVIHDQGRVLFANERFARLFGPRPQDIPGIHIETFIAPEQRPDATAHIVSGINEIFESIGLTHDGNTFPVEFQTSEIEHEGVSWQVLLARDLTRQKLVERRIQELSDTLARRDAELQAERARWQAVIEGLADEVWVSDDSGRLSMLKLSSSTEPGVKEFNGRTIDEVLNEVEMLRADGTLRPPAGAPVLRSLKGEVVREEEIVRNRRTGDMRNRYVSSAPMRNASGAITGSVAIVLDITDRKQAERELSELKDHLAVELSAMVWLHELSSRFARLNELHPLLEETLGAAIEITGAHMGCLQLLHPDTGLLRIEAQQGLIQALVELFNRGDSACSSVLQERERIVIDDIEQASTLAGQPALSVLRTAGVRAVQSTPLFSREGHLVGVLCTFYPSPRHPSERDLRLLDLLVRQAADLIERAQAQEALRRSEERLRLAAEATGFGTFDVNLFTNEVFWSRELKAIMGVPLDHESRLSTPAGDLLPVHPAERERLARIVATACDPSSDGTVEGEFRINRPDGTERWVLIKGRAFFHGEGDRRTVVRISGTVLDTTEHKRSEEALIRNEKLVSAGRMAATVAHEINNPLAAITNAVFLVALDPSLSKNARDKLDLVQRELERVAHLTRQTLGFYRETTSPSVFRLSAVVENVVELYAPKLRDKDIELVRRYDENDYVLAVSGELRQVISNLFTNAVEAVRHNGRIRLRTSRLATSNDSHGSVVFTIADNGIGMTAAQQARVFEPFFTTKESFGTGLGLWVTKELTLKARARIRVKSRLGVGTLFHLRFPAAEEKRDASAGNPNPREVA